MARDTAARLCACSLYRRCVLQECQNCEHWWAYVFPMIVLSARVWREGSRARGAESADFEQAGMQETTAAENARRRLRTLNP